jgi:hypothetical protein
MAVLKKWAAGGGQRCPPLTFMLTAIGIIFAWLLGVALLLLTIGAILTGIPTAPRREAPDESGKRRVDVLPPQG